MTDNRANEELRALLDERGADWRVEFDGATEWESAAGDYSSAVEVGDGKLVFTGCLTPEQAVAATLGSDDEYEAKMDALLCRLTNGKWSKSRSYDLDFMVSCVDEEFEDLYAKELADATLGNGTLTAEQVRDVFLENFEKAHETSYDLWEPSTFNWQAIADELNAALGVVECEMVTSGTPCDGNTDKACTACGAYNIGEFYNEQSHRAVPNFCPNCGAKVRKAVDR